MNASVVGVRKRADLLSLSGATLAGFAAGAWFGGWLAPFASVVLVCGIVVHAIGMTARHRLDLGEGKLPRFWTWLYVACWTMLAGTVAWIAFVLLRGRP